MNLLKYITKRMLKICIITILISTICAMQSNAEKIILGGTESVKNSAYGKFLEMIFTEAFHRLGYEFQYNGFPAARASVMSDNGDVDGEISRVFEYQTDHPNLIRVEEFLYTTNFVAYAFKSGIKIQGWKSLLNTSYIVEYRRGVKLSETELSAIVKPDHLSIVENSEQGLKKLIAGRTDLYIDLDFTIDEAIKKLQPSEFKVSSLYQAGIMQEVKAYAYLHKKRAALIPKLVAVLKEMKQEGLFEKYLTKASK